MDHTGSQQVLRRLPPARNRQCSCIPSAPLLRFQDRCSWLRMSRQLLYYPCLYIGWRLNHHQGRRIQQCTGHSLLHTSLADIQMCILLLSVNTHLHTSTGSQRCLPRSHCRLHTMEWCWCTASRTRPSAHCSPQSGRDQCHMGHTHHILDMDVTLSGRRIQMRHSPHIRF
jgi:hypothetical protein